MTAISTMKTTAYTAAFFMSSDSLPVRSQAAEPMAMDCGANILPADTPTEFAATIHSGDAPILMAAGAAMRGVVLTGTRRLAIKESDRGAAMAEELAKFGVRVDRTADTITVHGGTLRAPTTPLSGHNDHRIVMALATLCALVGGTVEGAEAVRKSLPDYFDRMNSLGLEMIPYEA